MTPPAPAPSRTKVGHLTVEVDLAYGTGREEQVCWLVQRAVEQALAADANEILHTIVGLDPLR